MTSEIKDILENMTTAAPEMEDYIGEDGLLYCGKCHTPKEAYFPEGKELFGRDRHPAECDCQRAAREQRQAAEEHRRHVEAVENLKQRAFADSAMQQWTFENDNGRNPQTGIARRYAEHWEEMQAENIGCLFWGNVGNGKSYLAGCIANALMEKEVPVYMTNFAVILGDLSPGFTGRNEYISRLCRYPLLKHSVENPIEKQAIFPNHHEPIIDTETWERVQELRKQRKRPNRYDEVGLFSGMLFCADCGHVLYQQRYQNKNRKQDCYICGSYKKRTRDCTAHFIRTDLLTAGVLSNLRQVTEYAARHESRFVKLLIQQNEIGGKRKTAAATKQLEQAQTRIAEVNRIIKRLYEDNVSGKISDERFMELSADYEQEQRELKDRAAALQEELSKSQAATVNAEKFMGIVRKHLAFEELTPTLLREMIEKIVVHECSYDENGTRRQDIEIYYSFVGKIDLPEA